MQQRLQRTLTAFLAAAAAIVIVALAVPGYLRPDAWVRPSISAIVVGCLAAVVVLQRAPLPPHHFLPVALTLDSLAAIGSTMTASASTATFCLAALSSITMLTAYQGRRRVLLVQMAVASAIVVWRGVSSFAAASDVAMYVLWSEFGLVLPGYALFLLIGDLTGSLRAADYFAGHDVLTGLLNRHGLAQVAPSLVADAAAAGAPLGAIMCDLDRFKRLNDTYGHAAGDEALRCFAEVLRQETGTAVAVRLGGEEFAVLAPGTASELTELGERIRTAVHEAGERWALTVSMGVAVANGSTTGRSVARTDSAVDPATDNDADAVVWSLLAAADEAVYAAKAGGRDRVCVHRPQLRGRRGRAATRHVPETQPS